LPYPHSTHHQLSPVPAGVWEPALPQGPLRQRVPLPEQEQEQEQLLSHYPPTGCVIG